MYIPNHFKQPDENEVHSFIKDNGFATLISHVDGKLWASHIPLLLSDDCKTLSGHISKGNKSWRSFGSSEVLAIFQGPHAYISSSWYDHENVPTWNYIAIHVYGTIRILGDDELYQSLKAMLDKYEATVEHPVRMESLSEDYLTQHLRAVVGFEISITHIEASYKLSQNRDDKNHQAIVDALEKTGNANAIAVAREMKK